MTSSRNLIFSPQTDYWIGLWRVIGECENGPIVCESQVPNEQCNNLTFAEASRCCQCRKKFRWISNYDAPLQYSGWSLNQPYGLKGHECVVLSARGQYFWADTQCNARNPFICKQRLINSGKV